MPEPEKCEVKPETVAKIAELLRADVPKLHYAALSLYAGKLFESVPVIHFGEQPKIKS